MKRSLRDRTLQVGFLLTLATAAGWVQPAGSAAEGKAMRVELDVFSGRPNPTWDLTPKEGEEFLKRFRTLPKLEGGEIGQGLGYRGLVVTAPAGAVSGFDRLAVFDGVVRARGAGEEQRFLDKDRALERWLIGSGQGHVDKDLYGAIAKELKPD